MRYCDTAILNQIQSSMFYIVEHILVMLDLLCLIILIYLQPEFHRFKNHEFLYETKSLLYQHLTYLSKIHRKHKTIHKGFQILAANFIKQCAPD